MASKKSNAHAQKEQSSESKNVGLGLRYMNIWKRTEITLEYGFK